LNDDSGILVLPRFRPSKPALIISLAISPVFLSWPAAQSAAAQTTETTEITETIEATYDIYWTGLRVFTAESTVSFDDESYTHLVNMRSRGMLKVFVDAEMSIASRGQRSAGQILPVEYTSDSIWNDKIYARSVAFDESGHGQLTRNIVPQDDDDDGSYREAVPDDLAIGPDPLGLLAGIVLDHADAFTKTGESRVTFTSFDGVRSIEYEATCQLDENPLTPSGRSVYAGGAVRCSLDGRQTGGFWKPGENNEASARTQRRGARGGGRGGRSGGRGARGDNSGEDEERITSIDIWFASSADGRYHLPVRMEARGTIDLDIYLAETNLTLQSPGTLSAEND
jgi:Protein of unknown function (DUF3108)